MASDGVTVIGSNDSGWVPLTLGNGWATVNSGGGGPAARLIGDVVYLSGEIQGDATGTANPFTTLPWRPRVRIRVPIGWGSAITYVSIERNGDMWSGGAFTSSPGMHLGAISFARA